MSKHDKLHPIFTILITLAVVILAQVYANSVALFTRSSNEPNVCTDGHAQSPINLVDAISVNLTSIAFDYGETALNIFNNGYTIQVNVDNEQHIIYNEVEYGLQQFHFHHPSEHTINGESAAMELHLVHQTEYGMYAVVGMMMVAGDNPNEAYTRIFDNLPEEQGEPYSKGLSINIDDLLPEQAEFYTYNGSLTTPPCTETVRWLMMTEPVILSQAQIDHFASIFENNARPIQSLNTRDLFVDRAD